MGVLFSFTVKQSTGKYGLGGEIIQVIIGLKFEQENYKIEELKPNARVDREINSYTFNYHSKAFNNE